MITVNRDSAFNGDYHFKYNKKGSFNRLDKFNWIHYQQGKKQELISHDILMESLNQLKMEGITMTNPILNQLQKKAVKTIEIKKAEKKADNPIMLGMAKKGIIESQSELTINKFAAVEDMKKSLIAIDAKIAIYDAKVSTIEKDQVEIKSYLKQLNKVVSENNVLLVQLNKRLNEIQSIKQETIIKRNEKKAPDTVPAETVSKSIEVIPNDQSELINKLYKLFMDNFKSKFMGTKKLAHINTFDEMVQSIDLTTPETINSTIRQHWTNKRSQGVFIWAAGAQKKAIAAFINALNQLQGKAPDTVAPETVKDKKYYIEKLGIDADTMALIIETIKDHGAVDADTISAIRDYCKEAFPAFNEVKSFWQWVAGFIN